MPDSAPGRREIERLVAPNPGPMTLAGTNSYVVAIDARSYVIDPGPARAEHVDRLRESAERRGALAGILLTHGHADHAAAAELLEAPLLWPPAAAATLATNERPAPVGAGPFEVVPTPGHSPDHVVFLLAGVCFCGDLVLGKGSTFVPPDGGSLSAYLDSLRRLREIEPELLCPGHGPWITEPLAKIDEYIEHRLERERKLIAAIGRGERSRARLLDAAWDDVPGELRHAAAAVMEAHIDKLAAEGRLDPRELSA